MKNTKQLVKFDFDVAVITALDAKYKNMQITDGKSYALVKQGLAEYRELRLRIDDIHRELKKDILEAGRSLDGDKNRLKGLLEPGENYLKGVRKVWDDEKDRIKEEKAAKDRERVQVIQDRINSIRTLGIMHNATSQAIQDRLILVKGMALSIEIYQEFMTQAIGCHKEMIAVLEASLSERLQFEKEEGERKKEAERLEKVRKEQKAKEKEIEEKAAKIAEKERKLEAEKKAEEERKKQEEFERAATERAEAYAAQKAKDKAIEKEERERAEAKEKARQELLRPDKEKVIAFAERLYDIQIPIVDVKSMEAQQIISDAKDDLDELATYIKEKAQKL